MLLEKETIYGREAAEDQEEHETLLFEQPIQRSGAHLRSPWTYVHLGLVVLNVFALLFGARWVSKAVHGVSYGSERWSVFPDLATYPSRMRYKEDEDFKYMYPFSRHKERVDEAWDNLLIHGHLWFDKSEAATTGAHISDRPLVNLPNKTYYGTLWAYHALHCIHQLQRSVEVDNTLSAEERKLEKRHATHCLDFLRHEIMCRPNMEPMLYTWSDDVREPSLDQAETRQCVDWTDVEESIAGHRLNPFEPGLLSHPLYGDPYHGEPYPKLHPSSE